MYVLFLSVTFFLLSPPLYLPLSVYIYAYDSLSIFSISSFFPSSPYLCFSFFNMIYIHIFSISLSLSMPLSLCLSLYASLSLCLSLSMPVSFSLCLSLSFSTYLYFLSLSPCISTSLSVIFHFSFYYSLFQDIDEDYDPMAGYDSNVLNHPGGTYSPPILFYDHYFTFIFWSIQFLTLKEPFFEIISIFKKIDNAELQ